ncbi:MAG: hypothetical protein ACFB10_16635 [Salibacteraceae bacterium]
MNLLKTLCTYYSVGIEPLAHFCGASLSHLQSVSSGRRSLNLHTIEALLPLYEALQLESLEENLLPSAALQVKINADAGAYLQKLQKRIDQKALQVARFHMHQQQYLRGLRACKERLKNPDSNYTNEQKNWLQLRQAHLSSKLLSIVPLPALRAQLVGLQAEQEALAAMVAEGEQRTGIG